MEMIAIAALALSAVTYVLLGIRNFRGATRLRDHLPISGEGQARVDGATEFSAATVAATVSLATVILAFTELAGFFGLWLLWTAVTTAIGLVVLRIAAPIIWRRVSSFGEQRPTLHGFLGAAYGSPLLVRAAALCTSAGFLGAMAVELTVGSRFLAGLAPSIDPTAALVLLSAVGVGYTMLGGFRVVIQTDRIQMIMIWLAIAALAVLVVILASASGGLSAVVGRAPAGVFDFGWRDGLTSFLIGIAIINIPTFMADMSVWQRIAGAREESAVGGGITRSVIGALVSWSLLALLACFVASLVTAVPDTNPLATFLQVAHAQASLVASILVFVVIAGLYAAALSTSSTQLIAAGAAIHIDLLHRRGTITPLADTEKALRLARILVVALGLASVAIVELLRFAGFSIADLVFALYGSQLGLTPIVLLALVGDPKRNAGRGAWAAAAVILGFVAGWGTAGYGKWTGNGDLVFLAPLSSLALSSIICLCGMLLGGRNRQ
jgi:Na+/proline symporter